MTEHEDSQPVPEGIREKVIRVEAPDELGPDDNFYDQPPFDAIVQSFLQHNSRRLVRLDVSDLRYMLTKLAGALSDRRTEPEAVTELYERLLGSDSSHLSEQEDRKMLYRLLTPGKRNLAHLQIARLAIMHFRAELEDYPDWDVYIGSKLKSGGYQSNGEYTSTFEVVRLPQPSFMSFLAERTRRGEKLAKGARVIGLDLLFPQDLGGQSTAETIRDSGARARRSVRRTWEMRTWVRSTR